MISGDTIAAISSGVGAAPRMIVRLSGPDSARLAQELGAAQEQSAGSAQRAILTFDGLFFPAWVYRFQSPRSYSGEDLIEFHLPGNPVLAKMLLTELLKRGARPAQPGEFTARAYFNGRIDLTEAEGVAASIGASNQQELSAARQLLSGELARRLAPAMDLLAQTLALVEVGIDFSEEDVTFLSGEQLAERIRQVDDSLQQLLRDSTCFERLTHDPRVVLAGRPNAGKSTLLNALAGQPRAIVSPVAGTTRDVLSAQVALARGMVTLIDAAGLESDQEHPPVGDSPQAQIARKMREQGLRAIESADVLALVEDVTDTRERLRLSRPPDLIIRSKIDLAGSAGDIVEGELPVSVLTETGLDRLRDRLDAICFGGTPGAALALNVRHITAIHEARAAIGRAAERAAEGAELVALERREALDALGAILGRLAPDDLLARVFSQFCIGK